MGSLRCVMHCTWKNRVEIFERVEAGVVSERAFGAEFVEVDVAFENDFAGGRDFEVDGFALY